MSPVDRRAKYRLGLCTLYRPLYDQLCELLPARWQPYCGARTVAEQDLLWAQGRQHTGRIVTQAKGGQSAHNYGAASDWCLFEKSKAIWPTDLAEWDEYRDALTKVGLVWGGVFSSPDCPHNELQIACSWNRIYAEAKSTGNFSAYQLIEQMMIKKA